MRDEARVLAEIRDALPPPGDRVTAFRRVADVIRSAGGYRWVGLYEVSGGQIAIVAWAGPGEPRFPTFAATDGLCGDAVARRTTVTVGDVTKDARYLETFGTTRSEIVVPILDALSGQAKGVIDVESDRLDAFGREDRAFLERCAGELAAAVSPSPG